MRVLVCYVSFYFVLYHSLVDLCHPKVSGIIAYAVSKTSTQGSWTSLVKHASRSGDIQHDVGMWEIFIENQKL